MKIKEGFCQCGCGQRTRINLCNDPSHNWKKGEYRRFKQGHHPQKTGAEAHRWKGERVGYSALHKWVNNKLGRPSLCDACGTTTAKKFEWANISGEYRRDLRDWRRLCNTCHREFDGNIARGEKHYKAKLTEKEVVEIRKLYATGQYSKAKIGKIFNVSIGAIAGIVTRNNWKHVK